jgi:hypothetical protein
MALIGGKMQPFPNAAQATAVGDGQNPMFHSPCRALPSPPLLLLLLPPPPLLLLLLLLLSGVDDVSTSCGPTYLVHPVNLHGRNTQTAIACW